MPKHYVYVRPQYPELMKRVGPIVKLACEAINKAASEVEGNRMPYKAQWILEHVIEELQRRV